MASKFKCPFGCKASYTRSRDLKRKHIEIVHPIDAKLEQSPPPPDVKLEQVPPSPDVKLEQVPPSPDVKLEQSPPPPTELQSPEQISPDTSLSDKDDLTIEELLTAEMQPPQAGNEIETKLAQKSRLLDLVTAESLITKQKYRAEKSRRLSLEARLKSINFNSHQD